MHFKTNKPKQSVSGVSCYWVRDHVDGGLSVCTISVFPEEPACWINSLKRRLRARACDSHSRKGWQGVVPSHQQNMPPSL